MKDWKTSAAGVATILGGLCNAALELYQHKPVNLPVLFSTITAGAGLIKASDSKPAEK